MAQQKITLTGQFKNHPRILFPHLTLIWLVLDLTWLILKLAERDQIFQNFKNVYL